MKEIKFKIHDCNGSFLNFDLKDIIDVIGDKGEFFKWQIEYLEIESNKNKKPNELIRKTLLKLNNNEDVILSWSELIELSSSIFQTINCKIIGQNDQEKLIIEAFDSTFWELTLNDLETFERFKARFDEIKVL